MKKILVCLSLLAVIVIVYAQTDRAGTIVQIKGSEVIVKNEDPNSTFIIGEKLKLLTGDKSVILEVTFPMQTSARCKLIAGSFSKLKVGALVYSGGLQKGDTIEMKSSKVVKEKPELVSHNKKSDIENVSMKKAIVIPEDKYKLLMEYGGHRYYISRYTCTWTYARDSCIDYGGHLVTITSDSENNAIMQKLRENEIYKDVWIGCTDEKEDGHWEWVTGEPFQFSYWDTWQPDNHGGNEQYGKIYSEHKAYGWHDFRNNDLPAYYILEVE